MSKMIPNLEKLYCPPPPPPATPFFQETKKHKIKSLLYAKLKINLVKIQIKETNCLINLIYKFSFFWGLFSNYIICKRAYGILFLNWISMFSTYFRLRENHFQLIKIPLEVLKPSRIISFYRIPNVILFHFNNAKREHCTI